MSSAFPRYFCQVICNASVSGAAQVRVEDFQMSRYFLLDKWQSLRYPRIGENEETWRIRLYPLPRWPFAVVVFRSPNWR